MGIFFLWRGFSLGRSYAAKGASGWVMPLAAVALLVLLVLQPLFGKDGTGPIFFSAEGPGAAHAPLLVSLGVGLVVGWLAQRSRFCTVGALRDLVMLRDAHLFWGVAAFLVAALGVNLLLGQFHPGFEKQPVAHMNTLWNFLGMVLSSTTRKWRALPVSRSQPSRGTPCSKRSRHRPISRRPKHGWRQA